jgi:hypothetical protein
MVVLFGLRDENVTEVQSKFKKKYREGCFRLLDTVFLLKKFVRTLD